MGSAYVLLILLLIFISSNTTAAMLTEQFKNQSSILAVLGFVLIGFGLEERERVRISEL